jgi:mono/diheme cytochrome c family protein
VIQQFRNTLDSSAARARPVASLACVGALAGLLLAIAPGAVLAQTAKPAAPSAAGDAGRGKDVYAKSGCAGCHGASGQGASATRIVPMLHPLPAFTALVRQPASTAMPPLTPARASDAQVTDLYAFLRSFSPKVDTVAAAAPSGNAENGKKLYAAAACYACHGYVGQGGSAGPRLGPPAISFPAFIGELRHPREEMPPYTAKVLSDAQVADIYAHVKTFPQPPDVESIPLLKKPQR